MSRDKFVGMKREDPQIEAIRNKTFGEMKEEIVSICLERLKEKCTTDERKPWECPRCHKINAPWVEYCDCEPEQGKMTITPNDGTIKWYYPYPNPLPYWSVIPPSFGYPIFTSNHT